MQRFGLKLAVRGAGERELDVGDILLAQPARQVKIIISHFSRRFN